ncbi:MAG: hypothetical protein ACJ0BU_00160 [Candidatus Puniceispirillales bacterium]
MSDGQLIFWSLVVCIVGVSWFIYSDFKDGTSGIGFTILAIITVIGMIWLFFFNGLFPIG